MTRQSIAEFCTDNALTQFNIEINASAEHGYPFITFISSANEAMNVYFSKKGAELVAKGDTITRDLLAQFDIVHYTTEGGEERTKLATKGASKRGEIADLLA